MAHGTSCFLVLHLASMLRALLVASSLWLSHAMPNTTGKICQWGCYDEEDEACHPGLTNMACAEIYGHVEWIQVCDCVDEATGLRDNITVAAPRLVSLFYKFRREVYIGASLGFALCLLFGVGFLALASLTYQMIYSKEAHERKMKRQMEETLEATQA
ncbi:FTR1, partial [Symbiodinium necroappetens]